MKKLLSILLLAGLITESVTATPATRSYSLAKQRKEDRLTLLHARVAMHELVVGFLSGGLVLSCLGLTMAGYWTFDAVKSGEKNILAGALIAVMALVGTAGIRFFGKELFNTELKDLAESKKDFEEAKKDFTQEELKTIIG